MQRGIRTPLIFVSLKQIQDFRESNFKALINSKRLKLLQDDRTDTNFIALLRMHLWSFKRTFQDRLKHVFKAFQRKPSLGAPERLADRRGLAVPSCAKSSWPPLPGQLTTNVTITSYESWRQNLMYILSLDKNFVPFLETTWQKQTATNPVWALPMMARPNEHEVTSKNKDKGGNLYEVMRFTWNLSCGVRDRKRKSSRTLIIYIQNISQLFNQSVFKQWRVLT